MQRAVEQLQREGCLEYVTVVAAPVDSPPGLRYLVRSMYIHIWGRGGELMCVCVYVCIIDVCDYSSVCMCRWMRSPFVLVYGKLMKSHRPNPTPQPPQ